MNDEDEARAACPCGWAGPWRDHLSDVRHDEDNHECGLVDDYDAVVSSLLDSYPREGVAIWLDRPHRRFGSERPIDLIKRGEGGRVLAEADALAGGPS